MDAVAPDRSHSNAAVGPGHDWPGSDGGRGQRGVRQALGMLLALSITGPAAADRPLKYRFAVGDHLVYERRAVVRRLDDQQPVTTRVDQVQVWCLQREASEVLLLVQSLGSVEGRTEPAQGALLYMDETGRRGWPEEMLPRLGPLEPAIGLLPVLPLSIQSEDDWLGPPDLYGRQWRCGSRGPDDQQRGQLRVEFREEDPTHVLELLSQTRSGCFWFDASAGRVTRLESEERDDRARTQTRVVAVLRQTLTHTPQWAARRTDEARGFLRALRHEDRGLGEIVARPDELPRTLQQLDRLWSALKSDMDARAASPFIGLAEGRRQQIRVDADRFRAQAELGRRWLNQPAGHWSLQDLAGQTVTSEATRQGVVIECFWSAESVWGLRMLESVRRLQNERGVQPLRIICYNIDFDVQLARQAIERCGSGLTHILGGPLQDVERLPESPVLRVVDAAGIVRGIWVGWQWAYTDARDLARKLAEANPP